MPGGRLTYRERQRIASGLADGRRYSEIARALGRPTSTISREIAHHGGRDGYQPKTADEISRERARRPKRPEASSTPVADDSYGRDAGAVRGFEESFATLMISTGLPAMPARVLTCLFTHDSPTITAAELAGRLRVSSASISTATRYLEQIGLLRHASEGRRLVYIIDDDVWYRAWVNSAQSIRAWADIAHRGAQILGADTPAGTRLDDTSRFYQLLVADMITVAERSRDKIITACPPRDDATRSQDRGYSWRRTNDA